MGFVAWLAMAAILMLAELGSGAFYFVSVSLACVYASYAAYHDASVGTQLTALLIGSAVHILIVIALKKLRAPKNPEPVRNDIGQRVEVIEWIDECSARVNYLDRVWQADKLDSSMPDADHGTILEVRGNRLIITTEE